MKRATLAVLRRSICGSTVHPVSIADLERQTRGLARVSVHKDDIGSILLALEAARFTATPKPPRGDRVEIDVLDTEEGGA